jgi:hypothetical protein
MCTEPQLEKLDVSAQSGRDTATPKKHSFLAAVVLPLLVSLLTALHNLTRHRYLLLLTLAAACIFSWTLAARESEGNTFALGNGAINVATWCTTVLLAAYIALRSFIDYVCRDPKSPVRALYDCLELPPAPSPAKDIDTSRGFRFRRVASLDDIRLIAELCGKEPVFAAANPSLTTEKRLSLYQRWHELCPQSFFLLEHTKEDRVEVAAVSIILPLTAVGAARLWSGDVGVLELSKEDIAYDPNETIRLLLDTLFIAKKFRGIARHKKYPWALVLKHLSEFIGPNARLIQGFVLPDVPSTEKIFRQIGFEGPHSTGKEQGLYRIHVARRLCLSRDSAGDAVSFVPAKPMAKVLALLLEAEVLSRIFQNIDDCRRWATVDAR